MRKRVLYVAMHRPDRSPSQRFRFEQYIEYLKQQGYDYDFSFLITPSDDKIFYRPGNTLRKAYILLRCFVQRLRDAVRANRYDIIFIQREAFMTGTTFFERRFHRSKAKVIFDFDDSIWLQNVSEANKKLKFLKDATKTSKLIALSDLIFAGNAYLAGYARQFNDKVRIVPTTIDTDEYRRMMPAEKNPRVCIGWSGSITTIQHFKFAENALRVIRKKYGDRVEIKVIGDANYRNEELDVISLDWNKQDELKELSSFDIGIMPLPDDEWASGKCGLKGLQYMALEIPTIMSPVGVNTEIIQNGVNGYLASTDEEYVEYLSQLIENEELRKMIGAAGRKTVMDNYSVESTRQQYLDYFNELVKG